MSPAGILRQSHQVKPLAESGTTTAESSLCRLPPIYMYPQNLILANCSFHLRRSQDCAIRMDSPKGTAESGRFPVMIPYGIFLLRYCLPAPRIRELVRKEKIFRSARSSLPLVFVSSYTVFFHQLTR